GAGRGGSDASATRGALSGADEFRSNRAESRLKPMSSRLSAGVMDRVLARARFLGAADRLVALPQVLPHVADRVPQQLLHPFARPVRGGRADGLEDLPVLQEAVVLDSRRAAPAQSERAFKRGVDEPAERGKETVSRRLEN